MGRSNPILPPVPWSHDREDVPLWLANQGVPLKAWQEWVDRANELWLERNQSNLATSKTMNCFFLLIPMPMVIAVAMGVALATGFIAPFDRIPFVMGIIFLSVLCLYDLFHMQHLQGTIQISAK